MAVIGTGQVTLVDLTDAYSVILTSEAYVFPGTTSAAKAGSTTTQVIAMRGAEQVAATVTLSECTVPTGITLSKDTDATAPTITITASTSLTAHGEVVIPVHIGSDITITKKFSVGIALTGATGDTGAKGADAIVVSVTSSNGFIFKNTSVATTLTAHVYQAGVELNATQIAALGTIKWYKDGSTTATSTGATLAIDAGQVTNKASYVAQLES